MDWISEQTALYHGDDVCVCESVRVRREGGGGGPVSHSMDLWANKKFVVYLRFLQQRPNFMVCRVYPHKMFDPLWNNSNLIWCRKIQNMADTKSQR